MLSPWLKFVYLRVATAVAYQQSTEIQVMYIDVRYTYAHSTHAGDAQWDRVAKTAKKLPLGDVVRFWTRLILDRVG